MHIENTNQKEILNCLYISPLKVIKKGVKIVIIIIIAKRIKFQTIASKSSGYKRNFIL